MPPVPWHENVSGNSYKGATVADPKLANALVELDVGHYYDKGRLYSRPEYAYRTAMKYVTPDYFMLVRIQDKGRIGWAILILTTSVSTLDL